MKDEDLESWDDSLKDKKAPSIGANKELLRRALALNPSLREGAGDSNEMLAMIKSGRASPPAAAAAPIKSLTDAVRVMKGELDDARRAIAAERAVLDKRERELPRAVCNKLIDALLQIDPNMTSPKTAYILQTERTFLDAIGFSPARVVEREANPSPRAR